MSVLFATVSALPIGELARAWAPELQVDPHVLMREICQAAIRGDLFEADPTLNGHGPSLDMPGIEFSVHLDMPPAMLDQFGRTFIKKAAVLMFAEQRQLPPPSWWPAPSPRRRTSQADQATVDQ